MREHRRAKFCCMPFIDHNNIYIYIYIYIGGTEIFKPLVFLAQLVMKVLSSEKLKAIFQSASLQNQDKLLLVSSVSSKYIHTKKEINNDMNIYTHVHYTETKVFADVFLENGGDIRETINNQLREDLLSCWIAIRIRCCTTTIILIILARNWLQE